MYWDLNTQYRPHRSCSRDHRADITQVMPPPDARRLFRDNVPLNAKGYLDFISVSRGSLGL